MDKTAVERRQHLRYGVRLPLHYHVSQKGTLTRSGSGLTLNMSTTGVSFRCRKPLPVGAHIEMVIDWPARYGDIYPVDLLVTGFVVRSDHHATAIRMTSRRFRVAEAPDESIRVSA
jgi:c-di-GMP-binding flagellar brake protein YcgR